MNYTRTLIGMLLLTLSSFALAAGHDSGGHATGGAHAAGTASASAHSGARPSAAGGIMTSGPFKGVPVSQETLGGREAMVAHMPARGPLTPDERREVRSAGFIELHDEQGTYYCRRAQTSLAGWVSECFRFDARTDSEDIEGRAKDGKPKADPNGKGAPQQVKARVEYG
jgi:hypothetical protein